ncbi:hypothetical protein SUDANB146_04135 [Streptomyces sp. enrichment culture]
MRRSEARVLVGSVVRPPALVRWPALRRWSRRWPRPSSSSPNSAPVSSPWRPATADPLAGWGRRAEGGAFRFSLRGSRRAPSAGAGRRRRQARRSLGRPAAPQAVSRPARARPRTARAATSQIAVTTGTGLLAEQVVAYDRPTAGSQAQCRPGGRPSTSVAGLIEGGGPRRLRRGAKLPATVVGRPFPPRLPRCQTGRRTSPAARLPRGGPGGRLPRGTQPAWMVKTLDGSSDGNNHEQPRPHAYRSGTAEHRLTCENAGREGSRSTRTMCWQGRLRSSFTTATVTSRLGLRTRNMTSMSWGSMIPGIRPVGLVCRNTIRMMDLKDTSRTRRR